MVNGDLGKLKVKDIISGSYRRFVFKCFDDEEIYNCFNYEYVEKISYFLTILFCRSMKLLKRNGKLDYEDGLKKQWIYFNTNNELKKIFNSSDYISVIEELERLGIIYINKTKRNPHDTNKFFNEFRLSKSLIKTNKTVKLVKNKKLHNYIKNKNNNVDSVNFISKYEIECCKNLSINLSKTKLDDIIQNQFLEKKEQSIKESYYDFKLEKDKTLIRRRWIDNIDETEIEYKTLLEQTYYSFIYQLESLRIGDIDRNLFWKDENFGGRYYNVVSNLNRCFKSELKLDGERVVELDLRSSQFNCLYYLKSLIVNRDTNKFMMFNSILDNIIDGIYSKDKLLFGFDWFFELENKVYKDDYDFYSYCKSNWIMSNKKLIWESRTKKNKHNTHNGKSSWSDRDYIKKLLLYLTFSDDTNKNNRLIGKSNYNRLGRDVFGLEMWKFICRLKRIDLKEHCVKKDYKTYKNTSMLLQKIESVIMYFLMERLIQKNYKFISVFDSFLVKESESEEILELLNRLVGMINPCFRFNRKS